MRKTAHTVNSISSLSNFSEFSSFAATQEAESAIIHHPDSIKARKRLIQAYFFQYPDIADTVSLAKNHIEWILVNHPEEYSLYVEGKSFYIGDPHEEERIIQICKNTLENNTENALILKNMGHFLTNIDNLTAFLCFNKRAHLHPLSPSAAEDLIFFCSLFNNPILQEISRKYENTLGKWSEADYQSFLLIRNRFQFLIPKFLGSFLLYTNFFIDKFFSKNNELA